MISKISNNLTVLLQQVSELSAEKQFCPKDMEIADFYEGSLGEPAFVRVQRHMAECPYCQSRIGMIARLETTESDVEVPEDLLVTAKQYGRVFKSPYRYRPPTWVAAAMVVLALYTLNVLQPQISQISLSPPAAYLTDVNASRQLRSIDHPIRKPRVLTPTEGALVSPDNLLIRWTEIPGSLYYDLYIMSDAGDLLLDQRLDQTQWSVHQAGLFVAGAEYYIRVEAQLPDSRSFSTDHVLIRIGE